MEATSRTVSVLVVSVLVSGLAASSGSSAYKTAHHPFIVDFAIEVLEEDNYTYLSSYLIESGALKRIRDALETCDSLDLAKNHYYNPQTGLGLATFTPATEVAQTFFDKALNIYTSGDVNTAWYYFGWALHCVQDLTVPFHSNLDPLNGHSEYEEYAYDYRFFLPVPENGTYNVAANASEWVHYAATLSFDYYDDVSGDNATDPNFDTVLTLLYPKAIALTAGFIKFFADRAGVQDFNLYTIRRGATYVVVGWDDCPDEGFLRYELYVSADEDEIYDGDPYAVVYDRGLTTKTVSGLTLGEHYYVQVRAILTGSYSESNMLKVTPQWPLAFLLVPGITSLIAVGILLSKNHRVRRKVRK
jgi:phospholipase C